MKEGSVAGALARSSVLVVGAGGLGSPAALALARAGVGCIGVADDDRVELSNLQRQLLHGTPDLGRPKVDSARERLLELNPALQVEVHPVHLVAGNILPILEGYDLVVEGSDNLPTKFLVNDAAYFARKPAVIAAVLRFFGQLLVVRPGEGPCYRCLFRSLPPADVTPSCQEAGVLGAVPGILGGLQAAEAVKLLAGGHAAPGGEPTLPGPPGQRGLERRGPSRSGPVAGVGEPLREAIFLADALTGRYERVEVRRNPECPLCGQNPRITALEEENYRHPPATEPERESPLGWSPGAEGGSREVGSPGCPVAPATEPERESPFLSSSGPGGGLRGVG
ncbi:MAG: ThiF family adenylyltransferase [Nitrospinota bacterium]